jgi:hypothetical protein
MPAVLHHPHPLAAQISRPDHQLSKAVLDRLAPGNCHLPTHLVDRGSRMIVLVRIDPDRHHLSCPLCRD